MRYKAEKTTQVTGTGPRGQAIGPLEFTKGYYETKDPDEIAVLDAVATDPTNPVGFDPKDKEA